MEDFDLISLVHEKIFDYQSSHGHPPAAVLLSPTAFHWIRMIYNEERRLLGHSPLNEHTWTLHIEGAEVAVRVDEMLGDFEIKLI